MRDCRVFPPRAIKAPNEFFTKAIAKLDGKSEWSARLWKEEKPGSNNYIGRVLFRISYPENSFCVRMSCCLQLEAHDDWGGDFVRAQACLAVNSAWIGNCRWFQSLLELLMLQLQTLKRVFCAPNLCVST